MKKQELKFNVVPMIPTQLIMYVLYTYSVHELSSISSDIRILSKVPN